MPTHKEAIAFPRYLDPSQEAFLFWMCLIFLLFTLAGCATPQTPASPPAEHASYHPRHTLQTLDGEHFEVW